MCSNIGTPNNHDFPFGANGKVVVLSVPILKHFLFHNTYFSVPFSGNWSQSGTSSNRHSLDSDIKPEGYKFNSQYSLGKDSGRDSPTLEEENEYVSYVMESPYNTTQ